MVSSMTSRLDKQKSCLFEINEPTIHMYAKSCHTDNTLQNRCQRKQRNVRNYSMGNCFSETCLLFTLAARQQERARLSTDNGNGKRPTKLLSVTLLNSQPY
ncbi:hypothetical protein GOODEAATRI_010776 [Goodea atripinnis]|uniref:Uncharacterized protein n=1 Tax=Goodea atripinnis TaxID=208336 RepID=A0ABV0NJ60_9TELE